MGLTRYGFKEWFIITAVAGVVMAVDRLGSTTELILPRPQDVTTHVKVGDRVKGGVTILATLGAPKA